MLGLEEFRMYVDGRLKAWSTGSFERAVREILHYGATFATEGEITYERKVKGRWKTFDPSAE